MKITILGAGLAGSEAALHLSLQGFNVTLVESKPLNISPEVYSSDKPAELVCSNSFKSETPSTASALLKSEMRIAGSILLKLAEKAKVPAGASLAVDREIFSKEVLFAIDSSPQINFIRNKKIKDIYELKNLYPADFYIVATGPLTDEIFLHSIAESESYFYDAIAPVVTLDSLNLEKMFWGARYDKGEPDFLNIPLTKAEYESFVNALLSAEKLPYNSMEKPKFFERCMPIEVMAERGLETLAFGPFRPVGFKIEGKRPYAVIQLRAENKEKTTFNLVGCQTRMKQKSQKEVFSMIPGLENAEFLRYGSVHRNSFINAPLLLNPNLTLKKFPNTYIAGQLSGVEGYVESIFSGMWCAFSIIAASKNKTFTLPENNTMTGGIFKKLFEKTDNFQPVNANFSLLSLEIDGQKGKKERKNLYFELGTSNFAKFWENFKKISLKD